MFLVSLLYAIELFASVLVTDYFNYYGFITDIIFGGVSVLFLLFFF